MKYHFFIAFALLGIVLAGCKKSVETVSPTISNDQVEVTATSATFIWTVDWLGKRISVVEVSEHEDMTDSQFYGSEEELNKTDFRATVTDLKPTTKYYYRYWVWNSNYVNAKFVMTTKSFTTVPQPQQPKGVFSVSYSKKVYFSQGNLQYRTSDGRWRFASHQYDYIGASNNNISSSYDDWIDLFGWGTSGWESGAVCYQPWSTSIATSDYYPGNNSENNLTGDYANADWGVYNKIYNGGNTAGQWRTLTKNEWTYIFKDRSHASSKYGHGKVNGVCGMILLPDSWTLPEGLSFTAGTSSWNVYTKEQWAQMEDNGAVFLPAAGYRNGTLVIDVGSYGYYWSSTHFDSSEAHDVSFYSSGFYASDHDKRYYGYSVRLVSDVE